MAGLNHGWMDAYSDGVGTDEVGNSEEFDLVAPASGIFNICDAEFGNSFSVNSFDGHLFAASDGGEDGDFISGVDSFNIVRGVGFSVTFRLCLGESHTEVCLFLFHHGEDVICGSVEDAHHSNYIVSGKLVLEGLNEWNSTSDCGFIVQVESF